MASVPVDDEDACSTFLVEGFCDCLGQFAEHCVLFDGLMFEQHFPRQDIFRGDGQMVCTHDAHSVEDCFSIHFLMDGGDDGSHVAIDHELGHGDPERRRFAYDWVECFFTDQVIVCEHDDSRIDFDAANRG